MKASCLRRRHSQRTAAHVTCQYSGPFPLARWQRRGCSGVCLVAAPKPRPTPLVLHPGARDGDDRRAASMASRSRGRNRRRGWCVPLAMSDRESRETAEATPPPEATRPPRPPPPPPCHGGTRMSPNFVLLNATRCPTPRGWWPPWCKPATLSRTAPGRTRRSRCWRWSAIFTDC
jgi:hypothetical protein